MIAEIGKNFIDSTRKKTWSENLVDAERLVHHAKLAGATIAKFQCHVFADEQSKRHPSRWNWLKINEDGTPIEFWKELRAFCDWQQIEMLVTPMSMLAARRVNNLVQRWKVGSADIVDMELLEYLKSTGKPIIVSTGMSTNEQISEALDFLGDQVQCVLYCVSVYPCPVYKIDFRKMLMLTSQENPMEKYIPFGFSDHSLSIEVPALAVRMGAKVIEKHFTLDRNAFGPDHKVSLLPAEFKQMVDLCKKAETEGESFEEEKGHWEKFRSNIKSI